MNFKSFKFKLIVSISSSIIAAILILVTYSVISRRNFDKQQIVLYAHLASENCSKNIKSTIDKSFGVARTLAQSFLILSEQPNKERNNVNEILLNTLKNNADFFNIYSTWEPYAFDKLDKKYENAKYHDSSGRIMYYWIRLDSGNYKYEITSDYNTEGVGDYYLIPKRTKQETMTEPYEYLVNGKTVLMVSAVIPIVKNEEFKGIVGIDYGIDFIQKEALAMKTELFKGEAEVIILSAGKSIIANTQNPVRIGQLITKTDSLYYSGMLDQTNDKLNVWRKNDSLNIISRVYFGNTNKAWIIHFKMAESDIMKSANNQLIIYIIVSLLLIAICIVVIVFISNSLSAPIIRLKNSALKISKGHLYVDVKEEGDDEIGQLADSFRMMVQKLHEIIAVIKTSAENINSGSSQLSSSAQQIAVGANEQSASVEQVSASIDQILASINQNMENSLHTEKIAINAETGIIDGKKSVEQTIESLRQIEEYISVIKEIAAKTDLLAINATIEAAKVGEQGKGFAVVAGEVRKLAERSKSAAITIIDLTVKSLKIANHSNEVLENLIPNIQRTSKLIQEISAAGVEQNSGASQISSAIIQLSSIIQENASTAEEMASGAEEFLSLATNLIDAIDFFKLQHEERNMMDLQNTVLEYVKQAFKSMDKISASDDGKIKDQIIESISEKFSNPKSKIATHTVQKNKNGFDLDMKLDSKDAKDADFESF